MNSSIPIFQGFSDSLETRVSWKLMAALIFYYYSAEYKKIKRITWILLAICPKLCGNCAFPQIFHTRKLGEIKVFFALKHSIITGSASWLPNQFWKHCPAKQQPLRREIFKIFGKEAELDTGGLNILWMDLITP